MNYNFGTLRNVELREVWPHEALNFTQWVSTPEGIDLLSEAVGIDINFIRTEVQAGSFRVDILAEESNTRRKIIIENQLVGSDHKHLGQTIVYGADHDADIHIWIAKDFRDEHQAAIRYLNLRTDKNTGFFLVRVTVIQIDDSRPVPMFEVVERPNEWVKVVEGKTKGGGELGVKQYEFWTGLAQYSTDQGGDFRFRSPSARRSLDVHFGPKGVYFYLQLNSQKSSVGCSVYFKHDDGLFELLLGNKDQIDSELGFEVEWFAGNDRERPKIRVYHDFTDVFSSEGSLKCFGWLYDRMVKFRSVLGKYLKYQST